LGKHDPDRDGDVHKDTKIDPKDYPPPLPDDDDDD
jgi:hypothetical protein